jgi:GntR family transcriptional repressor for pyruvate dehydrogenase complex
LPEKVQKKQRTNLTQIVITHFREKIRGGIITPGSKLPTEMQMVAKFGVSRTVIREAIANLKADGLVESRHGIGVFALKPAKENTGFSDLFSQSDKISHIIETLELRAAVEIEAAGIAASRCSPAQEAHIRECFDELSKCMAAEKPTEDADFLFHKAIATATNNTQFKEFMEFLGRRTIPRSQLRKPMGEISLPPETELKFHEEHRAIMDAICQKDAPAARDAMRHHLQGSLNRYRAILAHQT